MVQRAERVERPRAVVVVGVKRERVEEGGSYVMFASAFEIPFVLLQCKVTMLSDMPCPILPISSPSITPWM